MTEISEIPFVYACFGGDSFDSMLFRKAIFSKEELKRRKIPFQRSYTATEDLEHHFGTYDEITLHPQIDFYRGHYYGGPLGPRIVFGAEILDLPDSYLLPVDQYAYHPKNSGNEYKFRDFEKDKARTRPEKEKILLEFLNSDQKVVPELHIKTNLPLNFAKVILIYHEWQAKYEPWAKHLGIPLVSFGDKENAILSKPAGRVIAEAYWNWRKNDTSN